MTDFRRGAVRPMECFSQGSAMIKDQFWLFVGITLVAMLIMQVLPLILMGPMMCGLYMCLFHKMRGGRVEFEQLFKGFDLFVPGMLVGLIQVVPVFIVTMLVAVPSVVALIALAPEPARRGAPAPPPEPLFFVILGVMVLIVMAVIAVTSMLFIFSFPLLIEYRMSPMEAVKTSAKAVMGNLGGVLGLLILNFLGSLAGVLLCYVGALIFMPVGFAAYAVAYRQVFSEPYAPNYAPPAPPQWER